MAKKEKETQVADEPKKVAVEMTETQRDDFIESQAKKIVAEESKPVVENKMRVHLKFGHRINGDLYGPGVVILGEALANQLAYQDEQALQSRIQESQGGRHLVEILGNGKTRAVPVPSTGEMV